MNLTRHSVQLISPAEVLLRIVVPVFSLSSPLYRHHRHRQHHRANRLFPRAEARQFSTFNRSPKTASPYSRRHDELINDRLVHLVSDDSGLLLPPEPPRDILARIDRKKDFLVEVAPAEKTNLAVCRIIPKRDFREYEKLKAKKPKGKQEQAKLLELNWAIGPNDLKHKLNRMKVFLEAGLRVELLVAKKRKGRDASPEEKEALLDVIMTFARSLEGVKEWKPMQWKRPHGEEEGEPQLETSGTKQKGGAALLFFEGTKKAKSATREAKVEDDAATGDSHHSQNQPKDPAVEA